MFFFLSYYTVNTIHSYRAVPLFRYHYPRSSGLHQLYTKYCTTCTLLLWPLQKRALSLGSRYKGIILPCMMWNEYGIEEVNCVVVNCRVQVVLRLCLDLAFSLQH